LTALLLNVADDDLLLQLSTSSPTLIIRSSNSAHFT